MKTINNIAVFLWSVAFVACVDVNLKNELPNISYYTLDNSTAESKFCEAYELIGLNSIEVPKENQNKILYKENSQIKTLKQVNFIRSIDKSLESLIIKEFHKNCLKIITPPLSGINLDYMLQIKILDFEIIKEDENAKAIINLLYQMTSKGHIWQTNLITQSQELNTFDEQSVIEALQIASLNAVRELVNKIIPK